MRIDGFAPGLLRGQVSIQRPDGQTLTLELTALPHGYDDQVRDWIPDPAPPAKGVLIDDKKRIVRDAAGRPLPNYQFHDPGYRAALRRQATRRAALILVKGLETDAKVHFDSVAKGSSPEDIAERADGILRELDEWGLSEGDVLAILEGIRQLSGMTEERLEAVREGFLREAPQETPGSSPSDADAPSAT